MYVKTLSLQQTSKRLLLPFLMIALFTCTLFVNATAGNTENTLNGKGKTLTEEDIQMLEEIAFEQTEQKKQGVSVVEVYNENHVLVYRAETEVPFQELPQRIQSRVSNCELLLDAGEKLYYIEK